MGRKVVDIETWSRKKTYDFFIKMVDPIVSVTVRIDLDNCYRAAKSKGRSLFVYYSYAIIKAINEIEEFRYRVIREGETTKVYLFDDVDLVSPIATDDKGGFTELRIAYNPDFEEFYKCAERIIASASVGMDPIVEYIPDATYAVVSALPLIDFTSMKATLKEPGGVNQVPLSSVGKISSCDGHRSAPLSIAVHHGFVDGYHLGQFFEKIQRTLDSF